MSNWVKINRKLMQNELVKKDGNYIGYIAYFVLQAQHQDGYTLNGITLKRGQMLTSQSKFGEVFGLNRQQVRTIFDALKATSVISTESTNKVTIVTVLNYGVYQGSDDDKVTSKVTSKVTTEQEGYNKKDKQEYKYTAFSVEQFDAIKSYRSLIKKPIKTQQAVSMLNNNFIECYDLGFTFDELFNIMASKQWQTVKSEWVLKERKQANNTSMNYEERRKANQSLKVEVYPNGNYKDGNGDIRNQWGYIA